MSYPIIGSGYSHNSHGELVDEKGDAVYCDIECCERRAEANVPVSERHAEGVRGESRCLCSFCYDAYITGVQHGRYHEAALRGGEPDFSKCYLDPPPQMELLALIGDGIVHRILAIPKDLPEEDVNDGDLNDLADFYNRQLNEIRGDVVVCSSVKEAMQAIRRACSHEVIPLEPPVQYPQAMADFSVNITDVAEGFKTKTGPDGVHSLTMVEMMALQGNHILGEVHAVICTGVIDTGEYGPELGGIYDTDYLFPDTGPVLSKVIATLQDRFPGLEIDPATTKFRRAGEEP